MNIGIFLVFLAIFFYFRVSIFNGLSYAANIIFHPVLSIGNNFGAKFKNISVYFSSKKTLSKENEDLKLKLSENEARLANHDSILSENEQLKEILGRRSEQPKLILAVVLDMPKQNPYGTMIIDVGTNNGVKNGDMVYAFGNVPIGLVDIAYENSSRAVLFSAGGQITKVSVNGIFFDLVGRGGGNFEMILPRGILLEKGEQAILPGLVPHAVAVVETIISDPRDSFQKALLTSPVNIDELKFVQVVPK